METLLKILRETFVTSFYLKAILICPIAGWAFTVIILDMEKRVFHREIEMDNPRKRKLICWMDLSVLCFALVSLLKAFL